jgi:TonB family protein
MWNKNEEMLLSIPMDIFPPLSRVSEALMRIIVAAITQIFVLSGCLMAQQEPVALSGQRELGKWWKNSEIVKKLELSEAQIDQIEQIFLSHRPALAELNKELKQRNEELRASMQVDPIDEAVIRAQTELVSSARSALEKENTSMTLSIRKALTGEQWKTLEGIKPAGPYTAGGPVTPPMIIYQRNPSYTQAARDAKVEGIVLLEAVVRKDGTVDSIRILKSLGYGLDQSAAQTVGKEWRFKPGTLDGKPVDVQISIEIAFRLY